MPSGVPSGPFRPPWGDRASWREVNDCIAGWIVRRGPRLSAVRSSADRIRRQIERLNPPMDALCREACGSCGTVCCGRATIWYDFRDLIYLHLAGLGPPSGQVMRHPHRPCPHLSAAGCRMDRSRRPFVCTWYLCPAHRKLLAGPFAPSAAPLLGGLERVRALRKAVEADFLVALS